MNVFSATPWVPALDEPLEAGAEHEQEQERLDQRGDHPQPVAAEADQLAAPDDLDRAQLRGEAALRDADTDDLGRRRGATVASGRSVVVLIACLRVITCIITRLRGLALILLGVADRGAGVGHEDVVERRPRDAHRLDRHAELGEQPRHELLAARHAEGDRALGDLGLDPESLLRARRSRPRRRRCGS